MSVHIQKHRFAVQPRGQLLAVHCLRDYLLEKEASVLLDKSTNGRHIYFSAKEILQSDNLFPYHEIETAACIFSEQD